MKSSWSAALIGALALIAVRLDAAEIRPGDLSAEPIVKTLEAGSRWSERTVGLTGGTVNALAIDPDNGNLVYAGTGRGLFRSIDGGNNWTRVELPIDGRVSDIEINAFNGDLIHVVVPCAYVRSTDRGVTWTSTFPRTCVENVDVDPSNNRVLIHNRTGNIDRSAAAEYSTDGGQSFQVLDLPGPSDLTGISMDVIYGTPGGYLVGYASSTRKLFKTVNNGTTWDDITANVRGSAQLSVAEVAVRPGHPSEYLLAERSFSGPGASIIHQSTNGGDTWVEVATGAFSGSNLIEMQFDPADNALLHYIDLRSTNGGFSWQNLDPSIGVRGRAQSVIATAIAPNRIYAGGEGFGIEISEDAGASWERSNRGLNAADIVDLALTANAAVAVTERQGIFRSTNFGETWTPAQQVGLEEQAALAVGFAPDGQEGVATFSGANLLSFASTTDAGATWTVSDLAGQVASLDSVGKVAVLGNGTALVSARVGGEAGVLPIELAGSVGAFSAFVNGVSGFPPTISLAADPADTDRVLAAFSDGPSHVFLSTDAGMSWVPAGVGIDATVDDLRFDPTVANRAFAVNEAGLFESTDGGATFTLRSTRPADALSVVISDRFSNLIVTGRNTANRGGLVSTDGGQGWVGMTSLLDTGRSWIPRSIQLKPGANRLMATDGANGTVGIAVRSLDTAGLVLAPAGLEAGDRFGQALAASGDRIAIGVPGDDDAGADAGAVYIYVRDGRNAVLEQKIVAPAGMVAGFGGVVAIDGDNLAIGTLVGESPGKGGALRAALFERLEQGWTFKAGLAPETPASGDAFGSTLALDGQTLLVGAPGDDESGPDSGAVYRFGLSASGVTAGNKMMSSQPTSGGKFGQGLAIQGGVAAIGSPAGSLGAFTAGIVELYEQIGANLRPVTTVAGNATNDADRFGAAVALTGSSLVVGAPGESGNAGAGYLFRLDGSEAVQGARVTATIATVGAGFGSTVSASSNQIAIGAPGRQSTFLYDQNLVLTETFLGASDQDAYGASVALTNQFLAIGAPETDNSTGVADLIISVDRVFDTSFE